MLRGEASVKTVRVPALRERIAQSFTQMIIEILYPVQGSFREHLLVPEPIVLAP